MSRAGFFFKRLAFSEGLFFLFPFDTQPRIISSRSAVCPTPKVIARLMGVPRTTMSLMSGAFGSGGDSFARGGLELKS
jgi:hypothetical protein